MPTHKRGADDSPLDPLMAPDSDEQENRMSVGAIASATDEHARPVPDGGSVEVRAVNSTGNQTVGELIGSLIGGMSGAQMAAVAAGGVILLAAMSNDDGGAVRHRPSKASCPKCGESKSKRGMMGHLRWSHDLDGDELETAKAEAGIGQ